MLENYDRLRIPPDAVARDGRYTRSVSDDVVLRTHSSANVPRALGELPEEEAVDVLLVVPGLVYGRDSIDRLHTGTLHQADVWRVRTGPPLTDQDLGGMIDTVIDTAVPGRRHPWAPASHPYTVDGGEVEVPDGEEWVENLECGLAHPEILSDAGLAHHTGLAMGVGPDRLVMLRKGRPDIRLPRSRRCPGGVPDDRSRSLPPGLQSSARAACISVAEEDADTLGDQVRTAPGPDADSVESVEILRRPRPRISRPRRSPGWESLRTG